MSLMYEEDIQSARPYKWSCFNIALAILLLLNPYPKWILPNGFFQILFLITTTFSLRYLTGVGLINSFDKYRQVILLALFLYVVYFCLPIFHKFQGGWILNAFLFIELLFFDSSVLSSSYKYLRIFFVVICISSLFVWGVHLIGIELPHYTYIPDFRYYLGDNYRIYGFSVSLCSGNSWDYGGGIERVCGAFAEPGHFGIYLGLLMAVKGFEFEDKYDYLFLITGLLTFSTAFLGILGLGILFRYFSKTEGKLIYLRNLLLGAIVVIILSALSSKIYETAFGRVFNYSNGLNPIELVESRTTNSSKFLFNKFLKSEDVLTGVDKNKIDDTVQVTNWRGGIYRYGIIGFSLIILLLLSIISDCALKFKLLLFGIAALIISHRIYLIYSLGIIIMFYYISNTDFDDYDCETDEGEIE